WLFFGLGWYRTRRASSLANAPEGGVMTTVGRGVSASMAIAANPRRTA
ncbi:unnamed protein product, partial [Ectocarpus fasciculatus]